MHVLSPENTDNVQELFIVQNPQNVSQVFTKGVGFTVIFFCTLSQVNRSTVQTDEVQLANKLKTHLTEPSKSKENEQDSEYTWHLYLMVV